MFESLDLATTGGSIGHKDTRKLICNFMETNRKLFSHWEGSRFNDYLDKMKVEGTWGTHIELSAYSELACIDIDIYDNINSLSPILEINHPHNTGKINLLFTNNCHYDALIKKDKISQFIPLVVPEEMNLSKKASSKRELAKVVKVSIPFNIDPVEKVKYSMSTKWLVIWVKCIFLRHIIIWQKIVRNT